MTPQIGDPPKVQELFKPFFQQKKITNKQLDSIWAKRGVPLAKQKYKLWRKKFRNQRNKWRESLPRGRDITISQSDAPRQIIYGKCRVGGIFSFAQSSTDNLSLHMVVTLAGHEIESVEALYLDSNLINLGAGSDISPADPRWSLTATTPDGSTLTIFNSRAFLALNSGADSQTAQSDLVSQLPTYWTSSHRQRGCAHVYLLLRWKKEVWVEGLPEIDFVVEGKKVYDPRTLSTAYSNNAALCIADFLMDMRYGFGAALADIDVSNTVGGLEWAADICDENVPLAAGGNEKRYACNGVFDADMTRDQILADMETSFAGFVTRIGGKWRFFPGEYLSSSLSLTADDLRGAVEIETVPSKTDNFNSIRGEFVASDENYEVTDFPSISVASFVTLDNGVTTWADLSLPCTTSSSMAQRIAMIALRSIREGLTVRASFGLKALRAMIGDNIDLTLTRYGWTNKVFKVLDLELSIERDLEIVVTLTLKEESSGIYSWDETQDEGAFAPSPNSGLPNPFVAIAPTTLILESGTTYLDVNADGTVFTRLRASWTAPADAFVTEGGSINIQIKTTAATRWIDYGTIQGDAEEYFFLGLREGVSYDVRIRSINGINVPSSWVTSTGHTFVGKTAPPSNVSGFSGALDTEGVLLTWSAISDLDIRHYEIRRGASWGAATVVTTGTSATSFRDIYFPTGSTTYLIKAVDTSGNSSTTAASTSVTPTAPSAVTNIRTNVIDNNILIRWDAPSSGSFEISYYNIYKGPTATAPYIIGRAYGTFFTYFTSLAEAATFWIEPVNKAGTAGTAASKAATIYPPPDYLLRAADALDTTAGTLLNAVANGTNAFIAAIDTTETWTTHFTNNSMTTIQDFISGGFTAFLSPSTPSSPGSYSEEIDLGVVVAGSRINLSYTTNQLAGASTITPTISYKEDSGDPWIDEVDALEIYASNFRYMKFEVEVDTTTSAGLTEISNLEYRVDLKKQTDSGSSTSSATLPTTVTFNLDFLDVESIQVTVGESSDGFIAVVDFADVANPTDFDVYVFNRSGTQVAKTFYWTAEGALNP